MGYVVSVMFYHCNTGVDVLSFIQRFSTDIIIDTNLIMSDLCIIYPYHLKGIVLQV